MDAAGRCGETSEQSEAEPAYRQVESRYHAALGRAEGIWGKAILPDVEQGMPTSEPVDCQPGTVLQAMRDAEVALDKEEASLCRGADAGHDAGGLGGTAQAVPGHRPARRAGA